MKSIVIEYCLFQKKSCLPLHQWAGAERTVLMISSLSVQILWLISHYGWGDSILKLYSVCSTHHHAFFIDLLLFYLAYVSLSLKVREMIIQQVFLSLASAKHPCFLLRFVFYPESVWPNGWQICSEPDIGAAHQRHTFYIMSALNVQALSMSFLGRQQRQSCHVASLVILRNVCPFNYSWVSEKEREPWRGGISCGTSKVVTFFSSIM